MKNHCLLQIKRERNIFVEINANTMEADEALYLLNDENEEDERVPVLKKSIKQLPTEQRIAIEKFFYENMSYQDIARATLFDLKKVKSYIQNGKRNLKNFIEKNR
jgi:RNA polymerase sigma-70 factor (ECF subfamily)